MVGAEHSNDAERHGLLTWLENLLKLTTAGVGLIAGIGLPAVAIHLAHFGVPLGTATYYDVLRAGILPALALAIIAMYCIVAGRALKRMSWREFLGLHSWLLLPLLLPVYILLLVGGLSGLLVEVWVILLPIRALFGRLSGIHVSNRYLLIASGGVLLVLILVLLLVLRKKSPRAPKVLRKRQNKAVASNVPDPLSPTFFTLFLLACALMPLPTMYFIKWLLHIWDPNLGKTIHHTYILLAAVGCGVVLTLFMAGLFVAISASSDKKDAGKHRRTIFGIAAAAYLAFEVSYSMWVYPRLYSGLGGGRPRPATLWLKQEDDGRDIATVLANSHITGADRLQRVDHVFILLDGEQNVVLTDTDRGPGKAILVSKTRLMAISW
jgi:hypothetical protein